MPPEYAIDGVFSVKSDVFSFGVLVLEIVSGKTNRGFIHPDHHHSLLGHAWMLFREGAALEVVDPSIRNSSYAFQMERSIHMGLLCVQQHPDDRPSMSLVTAMLTSDCELSEPKEPGFYIQRNVPHESASTRTESSSNDQLTITMLHGR
uniref:Protein kinase domain-containing protein n=1 Tax=Opuntia streptacantha TaxID=393608 RepID=A0A7C9CK38_OPUST